MKICILSEYFYPDSTGGTGTVLSKLVRQLRDTYTDLEIDVIPARIFFAEKPVICPTQQDWDGINIVRLNTPQPRKKSVRRRLAANLLFTAAAFRKLLTRRTKYDLVMVVTAPPTLPLAAQAYSRLTGTPYIYLVYDLFLDMAIAMDMVPSESKVIKAMKRVQKNWLRLRPRSSSSAVA
jgi:glycosyltransferase involved in cell wall biosynthesis